MKKLLVMAFLMTLASVGYSQIKLGNSVSYLQPAGDFGDFIDLGYGINLNAEVGLSVLAVTGEIGWKSFKPEIGDNINAWTVVAGVKKGLPGPLYIEARAGFFLPEEGDDEFILLPALGVRFAKIDANIGYQVLNDINYLNLRVAYFWLGK